MKGSAQILENKKTPCEITHYHSINPEYYLSISKAKSQGAAVGYVHFLPETVENSISLPRWAKNVFYKYMISFYKRMDYLVTVNPVFIEKLAAYGIPRNKVTYIPNVVSEERFILFPEKKEQPSENVTAFPRISLRFFVWDNYRSGKGFLILWKQPEDCRISSLYGQEVSLLGKFQKGMKKSAV